MHFVGLVFVEELTEDAVEAAMLPYNEHDHEDGRWDWYSIGGRWDGWIQGEEEMKRRQTDNGFNWAAENQDIDRNYIRCGDVTDELFERLTPYFTIYAGKWIERKSWNGKLKNFIVNEDFDKTFKMLVQENPNRYIVVVDAHS